MKYLLLLSVFCFVAYQDSMACSGFTIYKDSTIYVCKNTDATEQNPIMWFTPATDNSYGYVCFGWEIPWLADGMNDKGLVVSHFSAANKHLKNQPDKPIYQGALSELILAKCATVDDVKVLLKEYNLVSYKGNFMYSDRSGKSFVFEGDTVIDMNSFYQICTNTYLSEYDENSNPCWRYNTARQLILSTDTFSNDLCRDVLKSIQQDITRYSIIYDVENLKFSLYFFKDFDNKVDIDLVSQLLKGKQVIEMYTLFPENKEYQRLYIERQAPQNNVLMFLFLIFCGLLYLFTLVLWPSARYLKGMEFKDRNEKMPKPSFPKIWSFIICMLLSVYLAVLTGFSEAYQIGLPQEISNFPLFIRIIVHIPVLVVVLTIPLLILNFKVLRQNNQSRFFKWHLTINTLSYLILIGLFIYWGFLRIYI